MAPTAAGSLPTGVSTLAGHARIPTLTRPAESTAALISIGSTPAAAIHFLILPLFSIGPILASAIQALVPPFSRGATLSPIEVCSTATLTASVPLTGHVLTALSVK